MAEDGGTISSGFERDNAKNKMYAKVQSEFTSVSNELAEKNRLLAERDELIVQLRAQLLKSERDQRDVLEKTRNEQLKERADLLAYRKKLEDQVAELSSRKVPPKSTKENQQQNKRGSVFKFFPVESGDRR